MNTRAGSVADLNTVLALMDEAVAWLVEQGRTDQWGAEPFSGDEKKTAFIRNLVEEGDLFIAEIDEQPMGALIVNEAPMPYTPPVEERELYVRLLVTSRRHKGAGIGGKLIEFAREQARKRGIDLLRVDCYSGPDEKLVRFYESVGFTRSERINVRDDVHVQVFEDRVWRGTSVSTTRAAGPEGGTDEAVPPSGLVVAGVRCARRAAGSRR